MSGAPVPLLIPEPFADSAAGPNITTPIPETTGAPGNASWDLGFPPQTMQPESGGGSPPLGQDVNGILNTMSQHDYFGQAGQLYPFQAAVATAIGGYAVGARVLSSDGLTVWYNAVDANSTDPDGGGAAGWVAQFTYKHVAISVAPGGTFTLTPGQARCPVIIFTGALTAPATVVLPATLQQWLIVNSTTGAFSLTCKTAGGTGVAIPAGGASSPSGIYGDGGNIYLATTPLAVAISIPAVASTILERDANADAFVRYLNSSAALEMPAIGAVLVQNAAADGYLRKMSLVNFLATIFNNAALTGNSTAVTQAVGDATSKLATTAFANPSQNLVQNPGHVELPSGLVVNWGINATGVVTFDRAFTSQCFGGVCSSLRTSVGANGSNFFVPLSRFQGQVTFDANPGNGFWIAIGV